jgi:4-amino-4-deoxy-L-arabinose transferase-like glycosyltransferase
MVSVNTIPLTSNLKTDVSNSRVLDVVIVLGLLLVASFTFYVTPEFAANLPQDGPDFAVTAVNWLERARPVMSAYGYDFPSAHPFGTSLLLLPSYVLLGHGLGNGIYSILLCALATIALTYAIGLRLGGRMCGCFAALFLITHYGFWEYSQKIMSDMPSVFLGTAAVALLLTNRVGKGANLLRVAAGAALGFAVWVRYDSILLLAPTILLLPWDGMWRDRVRRVGAVLAGLAPFLFILAVYDQAAFGRPWRTGYHYWGAVGNVERRLFSAGYITRDGFMRLRRIDEPFPDNPILEGNGTFYSKSLLTESDTTRIFGNPLYWQLPSRPIYQALALVRTALGVIGLVACLATWRASDLRNRLSQWLIVATCLHVGFFLLFTSQEERYLLRLVPMFSVVNAIGLTVLLANCPNRAGRVTMVMFASALILTFAFYNWQMGFPSGNDLHVYGTLTEAARQIESNAVVISNFDPVRVDAYIIRGTDRMSVPLSRERPISVFINGASRLTPLEPFIASEDPGRVLALLQSGRPVYWLIDNPWSGRPSPELETLARSFRLEVLATASVDGKPERPYFGRVRSLAQKTLSAPS